MNASGSVKPSAKSAATPPGKPPLSPRADPSATPNPSLAATPQEAARTVAPDASSPAPRAQTPPVTPPHPQSSMPQGTLVSEHRLRLSVSAKKPPLHPPVSPTVLLSSAAQGRLETQSDSLLTRTQDPSGKPLVTFALSALPVCCYVQKVQALRQHSGSCLYIIRPSCVLSCPEHIRLVLALTVLCNC